MQPTYQTLIPKWVELLPVQEYTLALHDALATERYSVPFKPEEKTNVKFVLIDHMNLIVEYVENIDQFEEIIEDILLTSLLREQQT